MHDVIILVGTFPYPQEVSGYAAQWLSDMGSAASDNGITIQYCMAWPRHYLQSILVDAVNQIRVSGDYQPGNTQWRIGDTTILAEALGLAAFKDVSVLSVSITLVTHARTLARFPLTVFFTSRTFTLYLMRRSVSSRIPNLIPSWKQCLLLWLLVPWELETVWTQ